MKKLITAIFCACGLTLAAQAQNAATVVWTQSATPNVNYVLHWGAASRAYTGSVSVGTNTSGAVSLPNGKWFFAVTSVDAGLVESDFSNEAWATLPLATNKPQPAVIVRIRE